MSRCLSIFFLLILFLAKSNAQTVYKVTDSIAQKMYWYALKNPANTLFVHFDKNIYTNSENVWFTGYLLKSNDNEDHHTLSVAVIRNDDRSVVTEAKFVINQGLAFGNFFLPDSMPTGNYTFLCYTNQIINGYPSAMFIQPATIKTVNAAGFIANLSLIDSIKPGMDSARVLLKAYTADVTLVKGGAVTYYIGDRRNPLKTGKIKTDVFGEAKISVPLKQITGSNNILQAEIDNGKEIKTFSVTLPVYKKETIVKFYPEGGSLVDGVRNTVGWEVMNNEGEMMEVNGGLYKNDRLIQNIKTSAFGIGSFSITPEQAERYYVKLSGIEGQDSIYTLPVALLNGPAINIKNALAADTLNIQLTNKEAGTKWVVMVHNYRSTFINESILANRSTTIVKIPLTDVPKGLNTFTLLDTLGRPHAERLFFAHFDNRAVVNISTDSSSYSTRQKVSLKFNVTDAKHTPTSSIVSIACVQDNRIDIKKMTDIESYAYLRSELSSFAFKNKLLSRDPENMEYLEYLLLVKGWRRYTWQDFAEVKAGDTIQAKYSLTYKGITLLDQKSLKRPVQLNLKKFIAEKTSTLEFLKTDSSGNFQLTVDNLLSEPNRQLQLSVNNRLQDLYTIRVNDPYKEMNKKVATSLAINNYDLKSFAQTSQSVVLKSDEGGKRLIDVKVVAKKDESIFGVGLRGTNACGDYVCQYGILNCRNHPFDGYQPVVGRMYQGIIYQGCTSLTTQKKEDILTMNGIYSKKEFYVLDLSKTDQSDTQYLSTLYWNHSLLTNKNGEGEATFYTGDITGKFRIVIQGVNSTDVVYGEQFLEVRKR